MLIKGKTTFAGGTAYKLSPQDDIIIGRKAQIFASLSVANQAAIAYVDSFAPVVKVFGEIYSGYRGLVMASTALSGTSANFARVTVGKAGLIATGDDAISLNSMALRLVNDGVIRGGDNAIEITNHEGVSLIINHGQIQAYANAVAIGATAAGGRVTLINSGLIHSPSPFAAVSSAGGAAVIQWSIQNTGTMFGTVDLGEGNDLVDSARGRLFGAVYMFGGDDRFLPGAGQETVYGSAGIDTLDFSTGPAVTLDLFNPAANAGRAAGDTYTGFEIFIGSLRGGDRLLDERVELHNGDFRGLGGNDVISAGFGDDTITGGLGRDTLTGGMGTDIFVFNSAREGGDTITDFVANLDQIKISYSGFGIAKLPQDAGRLDPELFHVGDRAAERDDRFILKTSDTRFDTLWFDRDGSGRRYAPVLLAVLPENVGLTEASFALF